MIDTIKFDYFGSDIFMEFSINAEGVLESRLIEVGGCEIKENLKKSYIEELEDFAFNMILERKYDQ